MTILYIDTSSSFLYCALKQGEKVLCTVAEEFGTHLSELALPKIAEMFEKTRISPDSVDKIIVVNGPGSFTGIRIGLTIAKVYAWSKNIPITTISSLEAMAVSSRIDTYKIPILNARRGYVYTAVYDKENNEVLKPQHILFSKLQEFLNTLDNYVFISNDEFKEKFDTIEYNPDFDLIIKKYESKESMNPHTVNPEYLKLTEAEEKL